MNGLQSKIFSAVVARPRLAERGADRSKPGMILEIVSALER
jgi:hypothetical protein